MNGSALNRMMAVVFGSLLAIPAHLTAQESTENRANLAPHYKVIDLGTPLGWTFSQAATISGTGVISGLAAPSPTSLQRGVVWENGRIEELETLGGLNSAAAGAIRQGKVVAVGQAESADLDPNDENFCGYSTHEKCLPVVWRNGTATQLSTLGGNNGSAGPINAKGEIAGTVETDIRDPECPGAVAPNGTGPYVLDYKGVIWGPRAGEIRTLEPLPGDTVSVALWINDKGQAVGASGSCANTVVPPIAYGPHAVLWDNDGVPHDLGNLGSMAANAALSINNRGQIVGASSPTDESTPFDGNLAFLWTREKGMRSLGSLPGDVASVAGGINDRGDAVGFSIDPMGNSQAVVWQDASIANLNDLAVGDSPFDVLLGAYSINDAGEIVGFGLTPAGDVHGFLATPCDGEEDGESALGRVTHRIAIPEYVRDMVRTRFGDHRR